MNSLTFFPLFSLYGFSRDFPCSLGFVKQGDLRLFTFLSFDRDLHKPYNTTCLPWSSIFGMITMHLSLSAAAAKSLQSCPTLCDPIDGSPPGSPIPGILQARTLEWVAISFSNAWKWKVKVKSLSRVWLLATPWTAAYQAPPSIGFSGQQ